MDRLQNSFADGNRHRHRYHVRSPLVQSPLARWPRRLRIRSAFRAPAANKRAIFIATFAKLLLARAISLLRRSWQTGLGENDARARARFRHERILSIPAVRTRAGALALAQDSNILPSFLLSLTWSLTRALE
jgi:hypothetical protein